MARSYYELVAGSVEEVIQSIVAQGAIYTEDEYRCVVPCIHKLSLTQTGWSSG